MSDLNGTLKHEPTTTDELRAETKRLRAEIRYKQAKHHAKLTESIYYDDWQTGQDLWSRIRDRQIDYTNGVAMPPSQPSDRRHGGNWPLWNTEIELNELRQKSRVASRTNSYARGLLKNLTNYVIGKGFGYKAAAKKLVDVNPDQPGTQETDSAKKLVSQVQDFIDAFCNLNRWNCGADPTHGLDEVNCTREREAYRRVIRDGEAFIRFFFDPDGTTQVRFIEPEQIRQPDGVQWADGWSWGIKHQMHPFEDVEKRLAYNVAYQDYATSKDVAEEVPASEVVHIKEPDEDAAIKRGTPLFSWDTLEACERASKLQRNISKGSAIRAATAEIWEHETATQAQVTNLASGLADPVQRTNLRTGRQENIEEIPPGTIRRVGPGMKLAQLPAAMGAGTAEQIQAAQGDLRQACAAFTAPEYFAGSTNDANYATAKEAGTPFVNNAVTEQEHFKTAYLAVLWKAIRHGVDCGTLPEQALKIITIQVEAPGIEDENNLERAQEDQILISLGVKDRDTAIMERGGDPEVIKANNLEYQQQFGASGPALPMPGDDDGQDGQQQGQQRGPSPFSAGMESLLDAHRDLLKQLREAKDASGHEHAADGKFGSGGTKKADEPASGAKDGEQPAAGKSAPKHGERASSLAARHAELKQARIDTFNEVKADAEAAKGKAAEAFSSLNDHSDNLVPHGDEDHEFTQAYIALDSVVVDGRGLENPVDRFNNLKEIETAAKGALAVLPKGGTGTSDLDISPDEAKENKTRLQAIIQHAREARQHLKTYAQHRKEMKAIKAGEPLDVQESMIEAGADADWMKLLESANVQPPDTLPEVLDPTPALTSMVEGVKTELGTIKAELVEMKQPPPPKIITPDEDGKGWTIREGNRVKYMRREGKSWNIVETVE